MEASEKRRRRSSCHFLLLVQQLAAHEPGDRGIVGEDADRVGAALDLLLVPVQRAGWLGLNIAPSPESLTAA